MLIDIDMALARAAPKLRLDTLVRVRWMALIGQALAVLTVHFGFGFALPLAWCLGVIAVGAWLNIGLRIRYPATHRLDADSAMGLLAVDIVQLAALLALTGGLENPFSLLFLAPVLISATALPPRRTLVLGILVAVMATMLVFWHQPLPWAPGSSPQLPLLYVIGVWGALLLGVSFIAAYAHRVAAEGREIAHALAATEMVLAREQHLNQLDGLAAAAAHELGTPLATITLVSKELARALPADGPIGEDVALIRDQVQRCRTILSRITSLDSDTYGPLATLTLRQLLEELAAPHRPIGTKIRIETRGQGAEPSCRRNPGIVHALANLVDNAVDFARDSVVIFGRWTEAAVTIEILDDGPGFRPEVLLRAGEPYVTTRSQDHERHSGGMGLGLFISKTLLDRSGGTLVFSNRRPPGNGASARIVWPRAMFERRRSDDAPSS